jgi:hypothetical protein
MDRPGTVVRLPEEDEPMVEATVFCLGHTCYVKIQSVLRQRVEIQYPNSPVVRPC